MARNVEVKILGDAGSFERAFNKAGSTSAKFAKIAAAGAAAAGAAVAGFGVAAFKAANTHDEAVKAIGTGTGATGKALDALEKTYSRVFSTMPVASEDAATAIADFQTRTGATGETLEELSRAGLNLTKLLGGDVSTNVARVTRAMGDWGVSAEDGTLLMDKLFIASQSTGIAVDQLADQVVKFGSPMRQMGFELDDAIALFGKFEKEGVNAELVMGSLRIALGKMAREGITDSGEALEILVERIKNAGSVGEANALALDAFGARAGPDMAAAIREGRFEIDELITQLGDAEGAIDSNADAALTLSDRWTIVKNRASEAIVPIGDHLVGALEGAFDAVESKLGPALDNFAPKIVTAFDDAIEAIKPVIDAVVDLAKEHWPALKAQTVETFNAVKRIVGVVWRSVLQPIFEALEKILRDVLIPIFLDVRTIFAAMMTRIAAVLREHEPELKRIFGAIKTVIGDVGDVIKWLVDKIVLPILKPVFTTVIPVALGFAIEAVDTIISTFKTAREKIAEWVVKIRDAVSGAFSFASGGVAKIVQAARDTVGSFTDKVNFLKDKVGAWVAIVRDKFVEGFDAIKGALDKVVSPFEKFVDSIKWLVNNIKKVGDVFGMIGDFLTPGGQGIDAVTDALKARLSGVMGDPGHGVPGKNQWEPPLQHALALGQSFGLTPTTYGSHHPRQSAAIDWFGPSHKLTALAQWGVGKPGIDQLIYSPWGIWTQARAGEGVRPVTGTSVDGRSLFETHQDHLHMGTFDRGGFLMPGLTLALNDTGRPERVIGPHENLGATINLHIGFVERPADLARLIRDELVQLGYSNVNTGIA